MKLFPPDSTLVSIIPHLAHTPSRVPREVISIREIPKEYDHAIAHEKGRDLISKSLFFESTAQDS